MIRKYRVRYADEFYTWFGAFLEDAMLCAIAGPGSMLR